PADRAGGDRHEHGRGARRRDPARQRDPEHRGARARAGRGQEIARLAGERDLAGRPPGRGGGRRAPGVSTGVARVVPRGAQPALATFLGELGDLRAIDRLRAMLGEKDPTGQVAAAVALAKLGDDAALPLAREWLKKSEPRLRRAAAEVLVFLGAPEAGAAVGG